MGLFGRGGGGGRGRGDAKKDGAVVVKRNGDEENNMERNDNDPKKYQNAKEDLKKKNDDYDDDDYDDDDYDYDDYDDSLQRDEELIEAVEAFVGKTAVSVRGKILEEIRCSAEHAARTADRWFPLLTEYRANPARIAEDAESASFAVCLLLCAFFVLAPWQKTGTGNKVASGDRQKRLAAAAAAAAAAGGGVALLSRFNPLLRRSDSAGSFPVNPAASSSPPHHGSSGGSTRGAAAAGGWLEEGDSASALPLDEEDEETDEERFLADWEEISMRKYRRLVLPPHCKRVEKPRTFRPPPPSSRQLSLLGISGGVGNAAAAFPVDKTHDEEGRHGNGSSSNNNDDDEDDDVNDKDPAKRLQSYFRQFLFLLRSLLTYNYAGAGWTLIYWMQGIRKYRRTNSSPRLRQQSPEDEDGETEESTEDRREGSDGDGDGDGDDDDDRHCYDRNCRRRRDNHYYYDDGNDGNRDDEPHQDEVPSVSRPLHSFCRGCGASGSTPCPCPSSRADDGVEFQNDNPAAGALLSPEPRVLQQQENVFNNLSTITPKNDLLSSLEETKKRIASTKRRGVDPAACPAGRPHDGVPPTAPVFGSSRCLAAERSRSSASADSPFHEARIHHDDDDDDDDNNDDDDDDAAGNAEEDDDFHSVDANHCFGNYHQNSQGSQSPRKRVNCNGGGSNVRIRSRSSSVDVVAEEEENKVNVRQQNKRDGSSSPASVVPSLSTATTAVDTGAATTTTTRAKPIADDTAAFFFEPPNSHSSLRKLAVEVPWPDKNGYILGDEFLPNSKCTPLLVFVNSRSGPQQGQLLITQLRRLLNPIQVWDLADGPPDPVLESFCVFSGLRILVCGGDGTVSWIVSALEGLNLHERKGGHHRPKSSRSKWPPIAILPLGTGNDLARIYGWGGGYNNESLITILEQVAESYISLLDRWEVTIEDAAGRDRNKKKIETKTFFNYLGVGADAQAALQVHYLRESRPEWFFSRLVNKAWYGVFGAEDLLMASSVHVRKSIRLIADGVEIPLPQDSQGIIVLNIDSYAGGVPLWSHGYKPEDDENDRPRPRPPLRRTRSMDSLSSYPTANASSAWTATAASTASTRPFSSMGDRVDSVEDELFNLMSKEDKFATVTACDLPASCQDGILEIVSIRGAFHLGQIKVGLGNAQRLCQCREVSIVVKNKVAVQVDGEPWRQRACTLRVRRKKDPAVLLHRSNDDGGVETEMSKLLDWAEDRNLIDGRVHSILMKEFSRRIESKTQERRADSRKKWKMQHNMSGAGGAHMAWLKRAITSSSLSNMGAGSAGTTNDTAAGSNGGSLGRNAAFRGIAF